MAETRIITGQSDDTQKPFDDTEATRSVNSSTQSRGLSSESEHDNHITREGSETLKHFIYNPVTDLLESDRAIETTLSSLYFGKQHGIHSAGENVIFKNETSKVNWFPTWAGITRTAQHKATTRVYSDPQVIQETEGANYGDFRELYPNPNAVSVFGFKIRVGQVLSEGDRLRYNVNYYNGSQADVIGSTNFEDNLSTRIYEQDIVLTRDYAIGDLLELDFTHPVEVHSGQIIYDEIVVGRNGSGVYLQAKESTTPNIFFQEITLRTFEDKEVALKDDVDSIVSGAVYRGAYDAFNELPTLQDTAGGALNGDTFRVNVSGGSYEVGDLLIFNSTTDSYDHIPVQAITQDALEQSGLKVYDWYVKPNYVGDVKTGGAHTPFITMTDALAASSSGESIYFDGNVVITAPLTLPHSLNISCSFGSEIKYQNYHESNGDIFNFTGNGTQKFNFENITFKNAGEYGVLLKKTEEVNIRKCKFINCGWDGTQLNTVLPSAVSGGLGYDSPKTSLQAFYAGFNASNGGAVRLEECRKPLIRESRAEGNLRGFRLQDCGVNGGGFLVENQAIGNVDSGIYLAVGSLGGCQNITVAINYSAYNANNGLLVVGGINNKFSQNEVYGNWNAGLCDWGSANLTLRDCGLYNNNRSEFNGIGNTGDAMASIQLNDASSFLATAFAVNPNRRFLAEILDTQVHYTGLGSNTKRVGVLVGEDMGLLPANDSNIIKIDDVGFIGQDIAIDFSEASATNLSLVVGDNSYLNITETNIKEPSAGYYYELPFSNHVTNLLVADFEVTNTGGIIIKEGAAGSVLNPYKVNDLQAVAKGSEIAIILKGSKKIQFTVPVSGTSIEGSYVNSVLSLALVQLNDLFTNTTGFASGGNPVTNFSLVANDLTLVLDDGTSFTVDVTTLGVDENKFVSSGELVGSDLVLTMNDSSTITIDATNMINGSTLSALGQNWFVSYGANAGHQISNPTSGSFSANNAPIYFGQKLKVGTEFVWAQYHLVNHPTAFMSLGVWSGITSDASPTDSTAVTNWSTKFGFYSNTITEDTSTLANGGYSSKNTNLGAGVTYDSGAIFRLVYATDNHLRLYVDNVLTATTILAESGSDLDIQLTASNNGVDFPNFIRRNTNWDIVHDFNNSENDDISNGIENDTAIQSHLEINQGEKIMVNFNIAGKNARFGIDWTGDSSGVTNEHSKVKYAMAYGSSEQVIPQNGGEWDFNTASPRYTNTGNGKWTAGAGINAGMVSLKYHTDNTLELYSETYQEVIATLVDAMDGLPFRFTFLAGDVTPFHMIPLVSKQTIGQSFQPRTSYAPNVANQTVNITEGEVLNYQIVATDYIVNHWVEENAPSWMSMNQNTGELNGNAPAFVGDATDTIVVNCKASNSTGGVTNFTITVNVQEAVYTNTKSLKFAAGSNAYLTGNAANMNVMQRASNGTGASDAWSMSFWVRLGGNSATSTIFNYGGDTTLNDGGIVLTQQSINNLVFTYGSGANYIGFAASNVVTTNTWHHILITYDGGTTGASSGSLSDYYSRFKLVVDGVVQSPTFLQSNYGYTGSIPATNLFVGKNVFAGVNPLQYARINQMAFWDSDEFANRADIYNSGATHDLELLASSPSHYYEIENSVSTITDIIGNASFTGYNFTSSDLVTDTP